MQIHRFSGEGVSQCNLKILRAVTSRKRMKPRPPQGREADSTTIRKRLMCLRRTWKIPLWHPRGSITPSGCRFDFRDAEQAVVRRRFSHLERKMPSANLAVRLPGSPLQFRRLVCVRGLWRPHRVRLKRRFNWYQAWFSLSAAAMSILLRGEAGVEAANCLSDVAFVDHKT